MGKIGQKLPDAHFPSFVARVPAILGSAQSANNNYRKEAQQQQYSDGQKQKSMEDFLKKAILQ